MLSSHSLFFGTQNTNPLPSGAPSPRYGPGLPVCLCHPVPISGPGPSLLMVHPCPFQDGSLPRITPAGATLTPDSDPESVNMLSSEAQRLQNSVLPPLSTER